MFAASFIPKLQRRGHVSPLASSYSDSLVTQASSIGTPISYVNCLGCHMRSGSATAAGRDGPIHSAP